MSLLNPYIRLLLLSAFLCTTSSISADETSLHNLPNPELANVWQAQSSPSDFLVSEKLDGVRARWDGERLYSRSGLIIAAPHWFTKGFPDEPLEGELWGGYSSFDQVSLIARGLTDDDAWRTIQYWLFDAPAAAGGFEQRYHHFQAFERLTPYLRVIPQTRGTDVNALQQRLDDIVTRGGEGLVLHQRNAPIVAGRSPYLFKFKPVDDAEAKVLAVLPGNGKYAGMMGSLLVETAEGVRFKIGTGFSDAERRTPPAIGSWITFAHNGVTSSGKPRFARFLRVRLDYELSHDAN
ncbi:hypothetical protein HR45_04440 [Shewanella mangrovi]|uniref:DNA ligase OB-like domain-containing protein n=1 Tax=Shewanella mangrovi TaxID=1515746 RepID=A0A094JKU7_9GAMM|nr:DNA ligase [Shewanella mangrovi]KFZ38679.1 hypothetical protein HR45_04440 [Shewanella mangrovi]